MEKTLTGIPGLDEITGGGLPKGRITLVTGDAGAGKTILAMQQLVSGARDFGEPGVFVSFEEHTDEIASNFELFGWSIVPAEGLRRKPVAPGAVVMVDANLAPETVTAGSFDLSGILAAVSAAINATSARRVVFDGIDVLLDLLDDLRARRTELARLKEWTRRAGVTVIVTAKQAGDRQADVGNGYEFLRYIVSCVIDLEKAPQPNRIERVARVSKVRGSGHSSSDHPLVIRSSGMVIGDVGAVRLAYEASNVHISSGLARLDAMLGGGYFKASSVLISGAPGTAKSTLGGAFIEASCRRGDRSLLISFDEGFSQIKRNLASVNIQLEKYVESGLLSTAGFRTGRLGAEEHFYQIMELIDTYKPQVIVVDPISALDKVVGAEIAGAIAERLIDEAKLRGITILVTSLLTDQAETTESTRAQVSTIADTWIQLSFSVLNGERNRALTIIKSRGNAHSNQVRELILSSAGLDLADVYTQGGAVLMGAARMERELADQAALDKSARDSELALETIERDRTRLEFKLDEIKAELLDLDRQKMETQAEYAARQSTQTSRTSRLLEIRRADKPVDGPKTRLRK